MLRRAFIVGGEPTASLFANLAHAPTMLGGNRQLAHHRRYGDGALGHAFGAACDHHGAVCFRGQEMAHGTHPRADDNAAFRRRHRDEADTVAQRDGGHSGGEGALGARDSRAGHDGRSGHHGRGASRGHHPGGAAPLSDHVPQHRGGAGERRPGAGGSRRATWARRRGGSFAR